MPATARSTKASTSIRCSYCSAFWVSIRLWTVWRKDGTTIFEWLDRNFKGINGLGNIDDLTLTMVTTGRIIRRAYHCITACILLLFNSHLSQAFTIDNYQTTARTPRMPVCNAHHKADGSNEVSFGRFALISGLLWRHLDKLDIAPNFVNFQVKSCAFSAHLDWYKAG